VDAFDNWPHASIRFVMWRVLCRTDEFTIGFGMVSAFNLVLKATNLVLEQSKQYPGGNQLELKRLTTSFIRSF